LGFWGLNILILYFFKLKDSRKYYLLTNRCGDL